LFTLRITNMTTRTHHFNSLVCKIITITSKNTLGNITSLNKTAGTTSFKSNKSIKFHLGYILQEFFREVNSFFQAFISFHRMMDSVLVGRETNRIQFLEEHSINRPLPLGFEPQTQFTGFTFLQIVFIVSIAYRITLGKSTIF